MLVCFFLLLKWFFSSFFLCIYILFSTLLILLRMDRSMSIQLKLSVLFVVIGQIDIYIWLYYKNWTKLVKVENMQQQQQHQTKLLRIAAPKMPACGFCYCWWILYIILHNSLAFTVNPLIKYAEYAIFSSLINVF